jgi:hypothetical protein
MAGVDAGNAKNRPNPQTTQANSYGYPGERGSGAALIEKAATNRSNGKPKGR